MTKRIQEAVEVLRAGGYWRKALETEYRGGEKFHTRLRANGGTAVKGFGLKCHAAMVAAGMLQRRECCTTSCWPEEWVLQ